MINPDDYELDGEGLDRMTRVQLAASDDPLAATACAVASVLDGWCLRQHGLTSSSHGAGLFLDLLAVGGYRVTPIDLDLTVDERSYLAMHARYESNRQDDSRYWNLDPAERDRLRRRWRQIADALHPDPWGQPKAPGP